MNDAFDYATVDIDFLTIVKEMNEGTRNVFFNLPCSNRVAMLVVVLCATVVLQSASASDEADLPAWLVEALKKQNPDSLGYQIDVSRCTGSASSIYDEERVTRAIEDAFTLGRIRPEPNETGELHLKVELVCTGIGRTSTFARVVFAPPSQSGPRMVYDWDFYKPAVIEFWEPVKTAIYDAMRAYVRANFDIPS